MATQVQNRRGTTAEHSTFTGAVGEVTIDTDKDTVVVHDGSTAGGRPLLREDGSNSALALGSAATPSLKFTGDPNTGIYSPGADQLALSTNGTGRLFVDANGNVGVSQSSPGTKLHVAGGNISILQSGGGAYISSRRCLGTVDNPTVINAADVELGGTFYSGWDGSSYSLGAQVVVGSTAAFSVGSTPAYYAIKTTPSGSASPLERLRITSAGLVGIGTSSPVAKFQINAQDGFRFDVGDNAYSYMQFGSALAGETTGEIGFERTTGNIYIKRGAPGSPSTALTIDANRRVGIGTTDPAEKLEVRDGNIGLDSAGSAVGDRTTERFYKRTDNGSTNGMAAIGMNGAGTNGFLGEIKFYTGASDVFNTSLSERLRITAAGLVGVGTSSPSTALDVVNATVPQLTLSNSTVVTDKYGLIAARQRASDTEPEGFAIIGSQSTDSVGNTIHIGGFFGETNAAESIRLYTAANSTTRSGTARLVIDSSGRVGIGTTSPSSNFHVRGSTSGTNILVDSATSTDYTYFNTKNTSGVDVQLAANGNSEARLVVVSNHPLALYTNNSERARFDSSGRLLVGTSSARTNFYNGANTAQIQLEGTNYQNAAFAIVCNANSDDKGSLILAKNRGTTVGSNTIVQDGDDLGSIEFQGSDGAEFVQAAAIKAEVDGTPGANDMPGRIILSTTADGASSPTERLRITNDGVQAYNQPAPAAVNATATLTVANLKAGIITSTSAAATDMTLPTGTDTQAGFSGTYDNFTFEWSVINTGPSLVRVLAATAHTIVGSGSVATGTSGRFASRRTAANTFVTYRLC